MTRVRLQVSLLLCAAVLCSGFVTKPGGGKKPLPPGTTVTTMVVSETSGFSQTNVPVTFGLPLAAGLITSGGSSIEVVDSDGVTLLPVQEDSRASDLGANVRMDAVTVILPNLTASQNRVLTVKTVDLPPATGTDISLANIQGVLTGVGNNDYVVTITDHSLGSDTLSCVFQASLSTALSAAGIWANQSTPVNLGQWRHGGGLATEYILYTPLTLVGVHAGCPAIQGSGNQLYVMFDVVAFKNGRGPVSVGNPITAIRVDRIIGSGWMQNTNLVTDDWYGLAETFGTATLPSFPNSKPVQTLTITSNVSTAVTNFTASSSLFTINSLGSFITDGTGYGQIVNYTSPTVVVVNVYKAFASGTLTSGNYVLWGMTQQYGSRHRQEAWFTGLAVPRYNVNLGTLWNGTSGGPSAYLISAGAILPYATPASAMTNSKTNLLTMGSNPVAFKANLGSTTGQYQDGLAGDLSMYLEASGERPDIGVEPDWVTSALVKYDGIGAAVGPGTAGPQVTGAYPWGVLFADADKANLMPWNYRDPTTGLTPMLNTAVTGTQGWYYNNGAVSWGIYNVGVSANNPSTANVNSWDVETAHLGQPCYAAYLLTGDWYWADYLQTAAFFGWLSQPSGYGGVGLNRIPILIDQMRGAAWNFRNLGEAVAMTPDGTSPVLGWPKVHGQTYLSNWFVAVNSGVPSTPLAPNNPPPGLNIQNTCDTTGALPAICTGGATGSLYAPVGGRWTSLGGNGHIASFWQLGYFVLSVYHLDELGLLDANGLAFFQWMEQGFTTAALDTADEVPYYLMQVEWYDVLYPLGTLLSTWAQEYAAVSGDWSSGHDYGNNRVPSSSFPMTLSALSGTAITATLPTGQFTNGGTWYVTNNGWICADKPCQPSGSGHGAALITGIVINSPLGSDTLTLSTSGTTNHDDGIATGYSFTSLTLAGGTYSIPYPYPTDPIGTELVSFYATSGGQGADYWDIDKASVLVADKLGFTNGVAACEAVFGFGPGGWSTAFGIKWNIAPTGSGTC